jgi:hypothetical protein
MPSTPTARLRLEKQGAGENNNTWGAPKLNTVLDLIDQAISGRTAISLNGNISLTATNYAADQARTMFLDITGTGGFITIPGVEKLYLVRNATTGNVILTTGGTTNASVPPGDSRWVMSDGTNVYLATQNNFVGQRLTQVGTPVVSDDAANKFYVDNTAFASLSGSLPGQSGHAGAALTTNGTSPGWTSFPIGTAAFINAGTSAFNVVELDASAKLPAVDGSALTNLPTSTGALIRAQTDNAKFATAKALADAAAPVVSASATGTVTLDFSTGFNFDLTLVGNVTLTVPSNMTSGQSGTIFLTQDSTGGRTLTLNAAIRKPLGIAPTLSTAAGAIDMLSYFVKGTTLYVSASQKAFA